MKYFFIILILSISIFGQNATKYEIINISNIEHIGKFNLELEKNDILKNGNTSLELYKGKVKGVENSVVRINKNPFLSGYIFDGKEFYNIKHIEGNTYSLLNSKEMASDTFLVDNDINIPTMDFTKGSTRISNQQIRVLEMATEADYLWYQQAGSVEQANNEILERLNLVSGVYESELNIRIIVVYQHVWTTPDPYEPETHDIIDTQDKFVAYWNEHFTNVHRDAAQLFSGREFTTAAGLAAGAVICQFNDTYSYSVLENTSFIDRGYEWLISAHELGHNLNALHVPNSGDCYHTIMNPGVSLGGGTFCQESIDQINAYVDQVGYCLAPVTEAHHYVENDFDGDQKADIAVFRGTTGYWYISASSAGFYGQQFGQNNDFIAPTDYDGDLKTDIAVVRNVGNEKYWYIMNSLDHTLSVTQFGESEDEVVPSDYDGDGFADVAVFRPSNGIWYVDGTLSGVFSIQFGQNGDIPIPQDYMNSQKANIAVFRPSNGVWYILDNGNITSISFGQNGDIPISGDFDGDRKADIAVFRPSNGNWYINKSLYGYYTTQFGQYGDTPISGDFDGDGMTDIGIYRISNQNNSAMWYINESSLGFQSIQFGEFGDIPIEIK